MKKVTSIVLALALLVVGFVAGTYMPRLSSIEMSNVSVTPSNSPIVLRLMVDDGAGNITTINDVTTQPGVSVAEVLQQLQEANQLSIQYKDYGGELGIFIESIGGIKNNTQQDQYWQFWVNNEHAAVGASQYRVQDGDIIEWKFIKSQF